MPLWQIDEVLSAKRDERVFRHHCPEYGRLILSDSQCGIYNEELFDPDDEYDDEPGCPWCGQLPPID